MSKDMNTETQGSGVEKRVVLLTQLPYKIMSNPIDDSYVITIPKKEIFSNYAFPNLDITGVYIEFTIPEDVYCKKGQKNADSN